MERHNRTLRADGSVLVEVKPELMQSSRMCPNCCNVYIIGDWPFCPHGAPGPFFTGDSQIHTSEKVTVMHNPATGETRIPGRADRPIHPKYAAAGFRYEKVDTHQQLRKLEKEKGVAHEASHFNSLGNELTAK